MLAAAHLTAAALAIPARGFAQTAQISSDLVVEGITGRDGNALTDLVNNPIGTDECLLGEDFTITLEFRNIPTDKTVLDFWRGPQGTDCSQPTNRDMTSGGTPACRHLTISADTTTGGASIRTISTSLANLFDRVATTNTADDGNAVCDADGTEDGKFSIYILALNSSGTNEAAGKAWWINATLDTTPPSAPTGTSGGKGDTEIPVSWTNSAEQISEQRVYLLRGGCSGGAYVGGSAVDAGADAGDDGGTGVGSGAGTGGWEKARDVSLSATRTTLNGASQGLAYGEEAAVAVTAVDLAGNESDRSTPACIQRVKTDGFCSVHESQGGKCESCAVAPGRGELPHAVLLLLGIAGAWVAVRRQRRSL